MDPVIFLLSIFSIVVGGIAMIRHKFYKRDIGSIFFATEIKVFLGGLIFFLIGCYYLVSEVSKLFK